MATQTPNLGLTLPVGGENVSRQIINQNMTLIDQYCGAINQSTYRLVPFTLAVNDWVSSGGQWVVNFLTAYVTASSDEIITFGSSLTNAQAHIIAEKKSGGGGVVFTTSTKPTGAIQGMIRIFDNDDHKIPILVEGTVTPIANGGTGQSTLSGAQQALGITALSNQLTDYINIATQNLTYTNINVSIRNGTGTFRNGVIACAYNDRFVAIKGAIRITGFARTGSNPGIEFTLPVSVKSATFYDAIMTSAADSEFATMNVNGTSASLTVSESATNYTNSIMTIIVPLIILGRS